ncbi:MAG TPA: hypothetical protein VHT95_07690 [Vicinamibacterales bacterium]|jgi:hypothetical protein|nr:hypothetical protein [Vicinamibacterales bacterium]
MKTALIAVAACLLAASTASAEVQLTMLNGRVSLVAKDATVRQILTEWARVGQTKIVNMERVPGGPITLELNNVTEAQALDVLLRALTGYITAPRPVEVANLSHFDRIIIMPTLAAARPATASAPPPVFQQTPQFTPPPVADDDADDQRPAPNVPVPGAPRGPVFNTFPQPQSPNPQVPQPGMPMPQQAPIGQQTPGGQSSPTPTVPYGGVAVPGMVAPPQPGQSQSPSAPGQQPARRPGPGGF